MGADRDAALAGNGERPRHDLGIARMQTAGDVGRGDDGKHGLIVTTAIGAKAFAKIRIQIDISHRGLLACDHWHGAKLLLKCLLEMSILHPPPSSLRTQGTHTPCPLVSAVDWIPSDTADARGYGSPEFTGTTAEYASAFSRRHPPECFKFIPP
jgi:hypothetical protein